MAIIQQNIKIGLYAMLPALWDRKYAKVLEGNKFLVRVGFFSEAFK